MPMTPFIGVRISWLVVARKRDFARLEFSASVRARFKASMAVASACMRRWVPRRQKYSPSVTPKVRMRPVSVRAMTGEEKLVASARNRLRPASTATTEAPAMSTP